MRRLVLHTLVITGTHVPLKSNISGFPENSINSTNIN